MRTVPSIIALLAVLAAPPARAVEPAVALRLGAGAGLGFAAEKVPMGDAVPVQFPVQLDLMGASGPIALGAYGSLGPGIVGRCSGAATCSAWTARVGLQGTWSFRTTTGLLPWAGLASGYEWASADRTRNGGTVTTRYRGLEPLALQGGLEWRVLRVLALGPYAVLSVGRYARYSVDTGLEAASVRIPSPTTHYWFQAGVRARLVLGDAP